MNSKEELFTKILLEFKPDDELGPPRPCENSETGLRMAADSSESELFETTRLLTSADGQVLVRILKNKAKKKYDLFFLSEDNRFSQYPILFEPDSFKYFIIRKDGHAEIPFSSTLDPTVERLSIVYPVQGGYHRIPESDNKQREAELYRTGNKLSFAFPLMITKALFIFTDKTNREITRLVPVRNGEAAVIVPPKVSENFWVSGF
ncbi:MAG: hypothetical protein GXO90_02920 [FCB group bacterium]|nr:hypothetical protein [FCB group bacterium]